MCIELLNYQEQHGKDFSNFFNLKEIDNDAQTLLDKFLNNPNMDYSKKMKEHQLLKLQKLWDLKYSQPGSMIETFLEQLVFLRNFEKNMVAIKLLS